MPNPVIPLATLLALLMLSACDAGPSTANAARALQPQDPAVATLYQRSCFACHGTGNPTAPQTGDTRAWAPRMAQGMDTLIDHVVDGYKGMPPMGLCMDCSAEDFEQLIVFMAQGAQ